MAVNTKGKRKVSVKGRPFIWHVEGKDEHIPEEGGFVDHTPERFLHIIATNKKFIVHYRIPKEGDEYTTLRVEGEQFPRQPGPKKCGCRAGNTTAKRTPPTISCATSSAGACLKKNRTLMNADKR